MMMMMMAYLNKVTVVWDVVHCLR